MAKKRKNLIDDLVDAIVALKELKSMDWAGKDNPILAELRDRDEKELQDRLVEEMKDKKA